MGKKEAPDRQYTDDFKIEAVPLSGVIVGTTCERW